jgi:Mor family transcriptional regulator
VTEQFIQRLQQRFGGDRLLIPKVDRDRRDAAILADWRNGQTVGEIAKAQGVTVRAVYYVINRTRARRKTSGEGGGFGSEEWNL